jgi:dTDP-4-amino-4,6-dideoxygalactose transaminase
MYEVFKPCVLPTALFLSPHSYFSRVPLAVPAWNPKTYREIVRAICSGQVIEGDRLQSLQSLTCETLGVQSTILCGSGSFALELALCACGVHHGDEVVIPTFCCSAVVPPILSLGATPMLADVGDELNVTAETVAAVVTRKTRVVIVPHLFGNPAEIQSIVELAHSRNLYVIDDAAQAFGASIDGQPVGSFGNFGILSFGTEKLCPSIGGGALVSRRNESFVHKSAPPLTSAPYVTTLRRCLSTLMWNRWNHWLAPVTKLRSSHRDPAAVPSPYNRESMANIYAAVAMTLVERLTENIAARRERVRMYQHLLGDQAQLKLIPHRAGSACLTQVVRILAQNRSRDPAAELVRVLCAQGYEVRGSYIPLHLLPGLSTCVWDRLPYADRVWSDLVELPCGPSVGFDELERIATIAKEVVNT